MEPIKKKKRTLLFPYILGMLAIFALVWIVQMKLYIREEEKNEALVYQMLGELESGISEKEAAANLLKGAAKPEALEKGLEILAEYGYDENYETVFRERRRGMAVKLIGIYFPVCVLFAAMFFLIRKKMEQRQKEEKRELQEILTQFQKGCYDFEADDYGEDELLAMRLESLGEKLRLNEERLIQEKEETKSLVTDLSHQLKTPLSSIEMSFQLLEDEALEPEERREFMQRLGAEIRHLSILMEALVNISRMESGMIHIQKQEAPIFQTVVEAVNQVYMKAERKNIEIEICDTPAELESLTLPHDVKWTKEALANILDNAVKYSPENTKVQIRMQKQTRFLRIEISDEGAGIPKEERNRVFQRFYRGKSTVVKEAEGSGVGLYLTRKILEEQGGNIIVVVPIGSESRKGTTFAVMLCLE